jgi:hypothetical protein
VALRTARFRKSRALTRYQKALTAIEAAAVKEPDNARVKARKAVLSAKIEAQQPVTK